MSQAAAHPLQLACRSLVLVRTRILFLALLPAIVGLAGCTAGTETAPGETPTAPALATLPASDPGTGLPGLLAATPGSVATPSAPSFTPLAGARAYTGTIGQAAYLIEVPADWNGELVLWAHGVRGFSSEVYAESPPPALRGALIRQGYAWAASSFSENGFIPGIATNDTLLLKWFFSEQFGRPARTYIAGNSMGGNVVTLSLENFPDEYDAGLSFCGVVAGEEWIDYLLAWVMAAEFIAGVELPLDEGPARVTAIVEADVLPALGPVANPTVRGLAFRSVVRNLTGGPRPFFVEGYRKAFAANFGLITGDPGRSMPLTRAATTDGIVFRADPGLGFDGDAVNEGVRRLAADMELRDPAKHPDTAPTTGRLKDPLLTLHESGDLTVPISLEQSYRQKVEATGTGDLLVQRIIRNGAHCEFSDTEITRAWNDLRAWVAGKGKPPGDDLTGDLTDAGRAFTEPLRPGDPGTIR